MVGPLWSALPLAEVSEHFRAAMEPLVNKEKNFSGPQHITRPLQVTPCQCTCGGISVMTSGNA
jgi:hypothetical protein